MHLVNAQLASTDDVVRAEWTSRSDCGHLYWAFTEGLGDWLGAPSSMSTPLEPGAAFCIDAHHEWGGGAHYGRFVQLHHDRRIVMRWISESLGGVESAVAIDLTPTERGSVVTVDHGGITDDRLRSRIERFWLAAQHALDELIFSAQPPNT